MYRHTRHNIIVHQRLHVSASNLIDHRAVQNSRQYEQELLEHRLCSAENSAFDFSVLCLSIASPVLYCSDIQRL